MKRQKGFTLIEVVIAIAILGILATLLAPGFRDVIRSNRLTSAANSFLSALNLARSEAVKLNAPVVICKSDVDNTPSGQAPRCATGGGFEQGWVVFVDADNDAEIDTDEVVLRVQNALSGETELTSDDTGKSLDNYVSYLGNGRTRAVNGMTQNGCLKLTDAPDAANPQHREIIINTIGRVRIDLVPEEEQPCRRRL